MRIICGRRCLPPAAPWAIEHRTISPKSAVQLAIMQRGPLGPLTPHRPFPHPRPPPCRYFCGSCDAKQNATRQLQLTALPEYLNVQLMRFTYDMKTFQKKKVRDGIVVPDLIDMTPYEIAADDSRAVPGPSTPPPAPCLYELTAVLYHKGGSASAGHYVADVWSDEQRSWMMCDDEAVEVSSAGGGGAKQQAAKAAVDALCKGVGVEQEQATEGLTPYQQHLQWLSGVTASAGTASGASTAVTASATVVCVAVPSASHAAPSATSTSDSGTVDVCDLSVDSAAETARSSSEDTQGKRKRVGAGAGRGKRFKPPRPLQPSANKTSKAVGNAESITHWSQCTTNGSHQAVEVVDVEMADAEPSPSPTQQPSQNQSTVSTAVQAGRPALPPTPRDTEACGMKHWTRRRRHPTLSQGAASKNAYMLVYRRVSQARAQRWFTHWVRSEQGEAFASGAVQKAQMQWDAERGRGTRGLVPTLFDAAPSFEYLMPPLSEAEIGTTEVPAAFQAELQAQAEVMQREHRMWKAEVARRT